MPQSSAFSVGILRPHHGRNDEFLDMEPSFDVSNITAAILAGGAGTRLGGRDKGLEMLAGKPLVAHVADALHGQAGRLLISANRNTDRYGEFAPVCADAATGFRGPLAGILAALTACQTQWLLTVPVDCPRPSVDLARRLWGALGEASAAVADTGAGREPLFALYRRGLVGSAQAALQRDLSVWRWQDEIGAVIVDFSDARAAFMNLNSPEDFRKWNSQ